MYPIEGNAESASSAREAKSRFGRQYMLAQAVLFRTRCPRMPCPPHAISSRT